MPQWWIFALLTFSIGVYFIQGLTTPGLEYTPPLDDPDPTFPDFTSTTTTPFVTPTTPPSTPTSPPNTTTPFVTPTIPPSTPTSPTSPPNTTTPFVTPTIPPSTPTSPTSQPNTTTPFPDFGNITTPTMVPTTTTALMNTTTTAAVTTASTSCNTTIFIPIGTTQFLTTPNYPSNYDTQTSCIYDISTVSGYAILVQFQAFSLEGSTYCNYDYLQVFDGSSSSASQKGQYCGTTVPAPITSSSNVLYVVFYSDYSIVSSGISAQVTVFDNSYPGCKLGYTEYTAITTVQTFSSSTTNGLYSSNTDEYFLVTKADVSVSLILQLSAMNVEKATNCRYDRIVIYDGGCTSFNILSEHCGTYLARWELIGSEYLVHFHTDASVQKSGFTMQYFTGVAGTGAPTTTTTTIGPPVSEEILLVNNVLTNYTAVNSPRRDFTVAITSTVNLALVGINGLDEVEQTLTTTVAFDITWKDDYMEWPVTKAAGISSLLIPQDDVWKPDITLMNGVEKITQMGASFMFVQVLNNGTCKWKPYQILKSTCNTKMSKYPYDIQTCQLKFSTWSSSGSDVTTVIGPEGMGRHADFVENSEWTLLEISQTTEVTNGKNVAVFTLKMQRNQRFVVFYIEIPIVMLSLLNVFTFVLPVNSGEKSGFGMTVFLSFVVYLIVTFQKLPENSESLSLFAIYLLTNSMISVITVMISCLEIRMITLKTKHRPLGSFAISFSNFFANLQMRMLRVKTRIEAIEPTQTDYPSERDQNNDNAWPNFVSALDFVCFFVFSGITVFLMLFFLIFLAV